ncbi:MAG: sigma-54-dependent Fis family transcriptional regulator [Deltaproteobacteria bacterium]|nr:sigma-54-dependent Fis family transcriptional regulator [Deltaproteobacteria bacterium]
MSMPGRIIIVDDDAGFSRGIARNLRRNGHDVTTCISASEAKATIGTLCPDVIVLDYNLPDSDGLALLEQLRPLAPGAELLMATAYPDLDVAVEAMRRGAVDYVAKGSDTRECLMRIERAAEVSLLRRRLLEASHPPTSSIESLGILGESPPMRALRSRLDALRSSDDTTTLILGETGTGKSLIARAIHAASGRAFEPFVAVDCTTIPSTLIESELFGYEKGAFSGAISSKQGRVEAAGRGTLFLDEIAELEMPVQVKLLRLLEEREFTRVGSTRTRKLQARIIAATNRDLEKAVRERRFRNDLRYRLEVFVVDMPPLRTLGDDIFRFAHHFAAERARAVGRPEPTMHADVLIAMNRYEFPGNVRELKNMVEQAVLISQRSELQLEDFPVLLRTASGWKPQGSLLPPPPEMTTETEFDFPRDLTLEVSDSGARNNAPLQRELGHQTAVGGLGEIRRRYAEIEQKKLVEALEVSGGNVSAAARMLKMSRHQLRRRLQKYGLA